MTASRFVSPHLPGFGPLLRQSPFSILPRPLLLRPLLAAALWASGLGAASAFDIPPPPPPAYDMLILPLFPDSSAVPFSGQSDGAGRRHPAPARSGAAGTASTLASDRPQVQASARELAQAMPAAYRTRMVEIYQQCFATWRELERKLGLPPDDVAGAIAAFIAGNYMAYRDVEVPDAAYLRLVEQLRTALRANPGLARASGAQRRKLYEQMAMVGTFMAVAQLNLKKQPDPQAARHFRDAAAANLETALQMPAAEIRISHEGLVRASGRP